MMKSGLLWYDADQRKAMATKIEEARERYVEKFGAQPNACHVAPGGEATHDSISVVPDRWIRPNYLWLGVDEELPAARPRRSRRDSEAIAAADRPSAESAGSARRRAGQGRRVARTPA
jgi:hypothetical protein